MKPRTLGGILLILLAGVWVYGPALHGGWLWDDAIDIVQNPVVHDPAGLRKIWLEPSGWHFFPLKSTVQWAQWQLWQDRTVGYHVTNLALHLAGALLIWRLLSRLGLRHGGLGGLLFAVHPLAVESVAWIAELKNTLSLPLLLLAALAWLDYDESGRGRDWARALGWFAVAMLAKSSVVMFPACLLLHALWRHPRLGWPRVRAILPFFAISAGLGLVTVWFEHRQDTAVLALMPTLGMGSRLAGAGAAIAFYVSKSVVPVGLSPVYPEWPLASAPFYWYLPWLAVLGVAVAGILRWSTWGGGVILGFGFFVVNLVPVLGFVPMAYHHIAWVADHFAYLSLIGLIGLAVAGFDWLAPRLPAHVAAGGGLMIAVVFALQSHSYAKAFQSEEALWTRAVATQPDAWLAHHNLAYRLAQLQRTGEAITEYQAALKLKPANADAANNLGNALLAKDRVNEAIAAYEQAIRVRPAYVEAEANLGNALGRAGRLPDAIAACERALQLDPKNLPAHTTLGDLYSQQGSFPEALDHYTSALALRPDDPVLLNNSATLLLQLGQPTEARERYERAVKLDPGYVAAHVNLAYAYNDRGRMDEAMQQWREAIRLAPDTVAAHVGLGNALAQAGKPVEAEEHFRVALRLQPADAEVHNSLAYALAQQGRVDEAVKECEEALRLSPGYDAARENLARLKALNRQP